MATINITFGFVGGKGGKDTHSPTFRAHGASQTVTSAGTSTQSTISAPTVTSGGVGVAALRLYSDVAIWYSIGQNPVAAANTTMYLPAGAVEYPYADKGDKIAVLEA